MLSVSSIWNAEKGGGTEKSSRAAVRDATAGSRHSGLNAARSASESQPPASVTARAMAFAIGPAVEGLRAALATWRNVAASSL